MPTENWARPIPDTSGWNPAATDSETLASAFSLECRATEGRLLSSLQHEKSLAIENFDSGLPFEGLVRDEIQRLLPRRYLTTNGVLLDRSGLTAGHCDVVIFNDLWFPFVKPSTPGGSGRIYMPIEGAYAVGEVKQALSTATLDAAAEKLVKCQRLGRPKTFANRIVENREADGCFHGLTNPLFTFIVAGGVGPRDDFQSLIKRFFDICQHLRRLEVIRALCVLGHGTVAWAFRDPKGGSELRPAIFERDDLFQPIVPVFFPAADRVPLACFMQILQLCLFHAVLAPEDLITAYGGDHGTAKFPDSSHIALPPDPEWLALLRKPCGESDYPE